ncbi:hypothetical protein MYX75_05580 [Acidobacteria bacterium AH-259-A15]|nr:hypothetical protein [Acidobacteria bacterium AH-259-A15]
MTNKTDFNWEGTATLREGNHEPWSTSWSVNVGAAVGSKATFDITLGPKETKKFILTGDSEARSGYLIISGIGDDLIVTSFFYNFLVSGQLVDSVGVAEGFQSLTALFPVEKTSTVNTGFAYASDVAAPPFQVVLSLIDEDGKRVQKKTLTFEGHLARFFTEVFDGISDGFVGSVLLESERLIYLTVIRLELTSTGFQLTSIAPGTP